MNNLIINCLRCRVELLMQSGGQYTSKVETDLVSTVVGGSGLLWLCNFYSNTIILALSSKILSSQLITMSHNTYHRIPVAQKSYFMSKLSHIGGENSANSG